MGYNQSAIRKGVTAEYLAKAFFSKQGYTILTADTHEKSYDFIIEKENVFQKVQVKAGIPSKTTKGPYEYLRFRNKHGSNNAKYTAEDYDILAGVDITNSTIYLYNHKYLIDEGFSETITAARLDKPDAQVTKKRPVPLLISPC